MSNVSSGIITLKIEVAETGEVVDVKINAANTTISDLKDLLIFHVPKENQLFLIGAPYKGMTNSDFTRDLSDQRIFLYNTLIFTDSYKEPDVKLAPMDILTVSNCASSDVFNKNAALDSSQSEAIKRVRSFEVDLLKSMKRGEHLNATSEKCRTECMKSFERQKVQKAGLKAALMECKEYYNKFHNLVTSIKDTHISQQGNHFDLLKTFGENLQKLKLIPLISGLAAIKSKGDNVGGNTSSNSVSSSDNNTNSTKFVVDQGGGSSTFVDVIPSDRSSSPRVSSARLGGQEALPESEIKIGSNNEVCEVRRGLSLYDCISVEKEQNWAQFAGEAYHGIDRLLELLESHYSIISKSVDKLESDFNLLDNESEASEIIISKIDSAILSQTDLFERLRSDVCKVSAEIRIINADEKKADNYFNEVLIPMSKRHKDDEVLDELERRAKDVMHLKNEVARIQTNLMKNVYISMMGIRSIQIHINFLKRKKESDTEATNKEPPLLFVLKNYANRRNEFFSHLETLRRLPEGYYNFLEELQRRHRFQALFDSKLQGMKDEIAKIRAVETENRKVFIKRWGSSLPDKFLEIMPSLRENAPAVLVKVTAVQWMPEISAEEISSITKNVIGLSSETTIVVSSIVPAPAVSAIVTIDSDKTDSLSARIRELELENETLKARLASAAFSKNTLASDGVASDGVGRPESQDSHQALVSEKDENNVDSSAKATDIVSKLESMFVKDGHPILEELKIALKDVTSPGDCVKTENEDFVTYFPRIIRNLMRTIDDTNTKLQDQREISLVLQSQLMQKGGHERGGSSMSSSSSLSASQSGIIPVNSLKCNSFQVNDVAMFIPTGKDAGNPRICTSWIAYNTHTPHYYLLPDCLSKIQAKHGQREDVVISCIIGKIVLIQDGRSVGGKDFSLLPPGTIYQFCDIEYIYCSKTKEQKI